MKNKTFSLFRGSMVVVLAMLSTAMMAQITATGVVEDAANGEPIIGASVLEVGTTNGTITDFDGNFSLKVANGATLSISYMGYKSQELPAAQNMKVRLGEDSELLEEVVVVGYGTQKRSELTGSITSVKGEQVSSRPAGSLAEALSGLAAGVMVSMTNNSPGSSPNILIRGAASVNGMEPLYVVDGGVLCYI